MISNLGIKTKLTGVVSFLVIAIISGVSYFTLTHFETATKEVISDEQFARVSLYAGEIDGKLRDMQELLVVMSGKVSPVFFRDPGRARKFLDDQKELHRIFDAGLYLFDNEGVMIAEAPQVSTGVGKNFAFREYIAVTLSAGRPYISEPYLSTAPEPHPSLMFTVPVSGSGGRMLGVLGGSVDLMKADIISRLVSAPVGKTGYLYVITRDRRILLHPDRSRILQQDVPVGANKLLEKAIEGFEGTGETVNSRGLHAITSFKSLRMKDWLVASNYPVAEAYQHLNSARNALLLITIVTAILVPLIVWYIMSALTGPLLSFTRHVETIKAKGGEERIYPVSSSDEIGKLTGAFNRMVADLDRHHAEIEAHKEEVEKLIGEIGEFNREIDTLLSERSMNLMSMTVADKIRNPSALIAGVVARLSARGEIPGHMKESFEVIAESSRDIEKTVKDFQSLYSARQSKFTYEDINLAIKEVATIMGRLSDKKGVSLEVGLAPGPLMVNTELSLLKIAVFHLVKNAIEATPTGGVVSVSTMPRGDKVEILVSDTGSGIPAGAIDRIFDPFFTTKDRSFGLGLPLVKQVVSAHMGVINVESKDGNGATFSILLPERWKEE
jgi:signal transduction histidine kinase